MSVGYVGAEVPLDQLKPGFVYALVSTRGPTAPAMFLGSNLDMNFKTLEIVGAFHFCNQWQNTVMVLQNKHTGVLEDDAGNVIHVHAILHVCPKPAD
jgi:hypothetical protein